MVALRNSAAINARINVPGFGHGHGHGGNGHRRFSSAEATSIVRSVGLEVLQVAPNPRIARAVRSLIGVTPEMLSTQHVVVARRPLEPGPLSLTVGMLTMNEEESIERMMNEIRAVAPDAKILCVDSSNKDQTHVIAERMGARVIRQLPPRGHGPAMEVLMYEAAKQSDALIYLDCDFTFPPSLIPSIRKILESGVDVVNAARTRTRPDAMPLPNYLANKSFALLAQATAGAKVADLHSGMRGYRSSTTRAFAFDGEGDAIPIDTLLWPAKCGYRVVEVPLDYQERVGESKLRKMAGTVWTFIRLARTLKVGERGSTHYEVWSGLDG
jgi:glycosyltransferase involved in cell wall biosynthesis